MPATLAQALCVIYQSTDEGKTWFPVKPELVPDWVKDPDVMANLLRGENAQNADAPLAWYRAERVDAGKETAQ
jgi:hypothetical protein